MNREEWGKGALVLGSFVFWLIAFPMQGFLLSDGGNHAGLSYFLFPLVPSLFLLPRLLDNSCFTMIAKVAAIVTMLLTLLFHFVPGLGWALLPLLGVVSVVLLFAALELVRKSTHPILSAAVGVAAGNLLVYLLARMPIDAGPKFFLIAIPLLFTIFFDYCPRTTESPSRSVPIGPLFLLFLFYLTGGLLYGFLMPLYEKSAVFTGAELLFYVAAATAVPFFSRDKHEWLLAAGVFLGAISFTLVQMNMPLTVNLGMFASQASFAFMDLFTVLFVVGIGTTRAYGIGFGTVCLGIGIGDVFCSRADSLLPFFAGVGNLALIGAVITLFFIGKASTDGGVWQVDPPEEDGAAPEINLSRVSVILAQIYEPYQKRLSPKELAVLLLILREKPYREIGVALRISESSVKTYAQRICQKLGATGRTSLVEQILNVNRLIDP